MRGIKVKDVMISNPVLIAESATLKGAASIMQKVSCGVLPVGDGGVLSGVITEHDIVTRVVAKGKDPAKEKVKDYMITTVHLCQESDSIKRAAEIMKKNRVNRLVVKNNQGDVSGVLSFGALLREYGHDEGVADIVRQAARRRKHAA